MIEALHSFWSSKRCKRRVPVALPVLLVAVAVQGHAASPYAKVEAVGVSEVRSSLNTATALVIKGQLVCIRAL